jgi:(E)-2-((N-methylformamido)methylene)succinate hydrolase
MAPVCPDPRELRQVLGCFVTGVTVVTTLEQQRLPRGFTANSFTSVSLDPPLVLVCIGRSAASHDAFAAGRGFAVNILSDGQQELSARFASRAVDKFAGVAWRAARGGGILLEGSLAWLDCRLERVIPAGDHSILLGEVLDFGRNALQPLAWCRGRYLPPLPLEGPQP